MRLDEIINSLRITGLALATATAVTTAGCSGSAYGSNPNPYGNPGPNPSPSIAPGAAIVGVNLSGETQTVDPTYGAVLGYFISGGTINTTSQVIHLTAAMPAVFQNFDTQPHTASFLGDATANGASFPAHFNGSGTASPANTVISTTNFSSGTLNGGAVSAQYDSGPPGFYMFGCAFHYDSFGMRTVIIVQ